MKYQSLDRHVRFWLDGDSVLKLYGISILELPTPSLAGSCFSFIIRWNINPQIATFVFSWIAIKLNDYLEYQSLDRQLRLWLYRGSVLKLGGISILGLPRLYLAGS
jgi:hypothetical protein